MGGYRIFPATFLLVLLMLPTAVSASCPARDKILGTMDQLLAQLPGPKRRILDDTLKNTNKQHSRLQDQRVRLEAELEALLAAPSFDMRTYLDKSAKLGTIKAKISANFEDAIAEAATRFTPEERGVLIRLRQLWHAHDCYEEWSRDDEKDNHQSEPE